jgi:hypothetical protein
MIHVNMLAPRRCRELEVDGHLCGRRFRVLVLAPGLYPRPLCPRHARQVARKTRRAARVAARSAYPSPADALNV